MRSEGYGDGGSCRSVCLSASYLTSRDIHRSTNDTASDKGRKLCGVFSETAAFGSYGVKTNWTSQISTGLPRDARSLAPRCAEAPGGCNVAGRVLTLASRVAYCGWHRYVRACARYSNPYCWAKTWQMHDGGKGMTHWKFWCLGSVLKGWN